jgi:hypothetical protein
MLSHRNTYSVQLTLVLTGALGTACAKRAPDEHTTRATTLPKPSIALDDASHVAVPPAAPEPMALSKSEPKAQEVFEFRLKQDQPPINVRVAFTVTDQGKRPVSIEFSRSVSPAFAQHFDLADIDPIDVSDKFSIEAEDINFDGYRDIVFDTRQGIANTYAHYWLFDPHSIGFEDLGEFPTFQIDEHTQRLSTYERNGYAGLQYERREYAYETGHLTLMRSEVQVATSKVDTFERTISTRQNGELRVTKRKHVRVPPGEQ